MRSLEKSNSEEESRMVVARSFSGGEKGELCLMELFSNEYKVSVLQDVRVLDVCYKII